MIEELKREIDDLKERLDNLIRVGVVSSTDPEAGTARVFFDYQSRVVSYNLQVMTKNSNRNKDYWMPDVGEQVTCVFLPTGIETGFILGSFFSDAAPPPVASQDKRHSTFGDGSIIELDRSTGKMLVKITGDADVEVGGNMVANVPGGTATVYSSGPMDLSSDTSLAMTAPTITFNGQTVFNGPMTQDGGGAGGATFAGSVDITDDATIGGISYLGHKHIDSTGGETDTPI